MNNENLVQQLDELMGMHRQLKTDGNDILSKVRGALTKKKSDDYERGLNDAWGLAQRIVEYSEYIPMVLHDMFGTYDTTMIINDFLYDEVLAKVEEYEKKKAEEAAKLVPGDVVTYLCCDKPETAIFLDECDDHYWVLSEKYTCPQRLCNQTFSLVKTGKHVDIEGLFEGIKDEQRN